MTLSPAARELLLDSEATLRLAGAAAADAAGPVDQHEPASSADARSVTALPDLVLRVHAEIDSILCRLRESRTAPAGNVPAMMTEIEDRLVLLTRILDPRVLGLGVYETFQTR
jgi:hypothetical protein